ncbi:unnamed protein product [Soboliphyme baturini]|uniref:ABC transporter domain-containing protein n=1 Tax=Soboliphyme baturini TaxID=241478 RepID=A0A183J1G4_9BILA|nr:unnamed protein product [Soboliphyme baturini]
MTELVSGNILLDNVDVSLVDLSVLRSRIAIIPQSPVLCNGTVLDNLMIGNQCTENIVKETIDRFNFADAINNIGGLNRMIGEGGAGLSFGERQVICLLRAMISHAKVIFVSFNFSTGTRKMLC